MKLLIPLFLAVILFTFEWLNDFVYSLTFPILGILSGVIGIISSIKVFGKSKLGLTFFLFALGYLLYGIAEAIWFYYETLQEIYLYPSIADAFFILGYFPIIIGILYQMKFAMFKIKKDTIASLLFFIIFAFVIATVIDLSTRIEGEEVETVEYLLNQAYPLLDIFVIYITLEAIGLFKKGTLEKILIIFLIANLFGNLGDLMFTFYDIFKLEILYTISDFFFLLDYSYVTFCYIMLYRCIRGKC